VVTETGGALSHAAIVARELRIPAVLGVAGATGRLRDGTVITLDGTAGTVVAIQTSTTPRVVPTTDRKETGREPNRTASR
jgi:pyruvate,water dikinase